MITFVDGGAVATIRDAATAMDHRPRQCFLRFAAVTWFVYFARLFFEWVAYRRCRCLTLFVDTAIIAAFGGWACIGAMIVGARQKGIAGRSRLAVLDLRAQRAAADAPACSKVPRATRRWASQTMRSSASLIHEMRSSKTIGLIAVLPASTESVIARHVSDRRRPATKRSLRLPGHYSQSGLPLGSRSDEV
jgi:hypothetical protein